MNNQKKSLINYENLSPARMQALVDGVFAIAMTLLAFNIKLPESSDFADSRALFSGLIGIWPIFLSFAIGFVILGMFWVSHHIEYNYIKKFDHALIWYNIFYLLLISLFPFTAALLGSHPYNQTAIIFYALHLIVMVFMHFFMWRHATSHKALIAQDLDPRINNLVNRLCYVAVLAYVLAIAATLIAPSVSLIIFLIVPLPYIFGWIYKIA